MHSTLRPAVFARRPASIRCCRGLLSIPGVKSITHEKVFRNEIPHSDKTKGYSGDATKSSRVHYFKLGTTFPELPYCMHMLQCLGRAFASMITHARA